jgi:hypothetical protein
MASNVLGRYPQDGETIEQLLSHADSALYSMKEGRLALQNPSKPPLGGKFISSNPSGFTTFHRCSRPRIASCNISKRPVSLFGNLAGKCLQKLSPR